MDIPKDMVRAGPKRQGCQAVYFQLAHKARADFVHVEPSFGSHGRAAARRRRAWTPLCPGHPRLACGPAAGKTWMPATSAGMTVERAIRSHRNML